LVLIFHGKSAHLLYKIWLEQLVAPTKSHSSIKVVNKILTDLVYTRMNSDYEALLAVLILSKAI